MLCAPSGILFGGVGSMSREAWLSSSVPDLVFKGKISHSLRISLTQFYHNFTPKQRWINVKLMPWHVDGLIDVALYVTVFGEWLA